MGTVWITREDHGIPYPFICLRLLTFLYMLFFGLAGGLGIKWQGTRREGQRLIPIRWQGKCAERDLAVLPHNAVLVKERRFQ